MNYTLSVLHDQLKSRKYSVSSIICSPEATGAASISVHVDPSFNRFSFSRPLHDPEPDMLYIYEYKEGLSIIQNGLFSFNVFYADHNEICEAVVRICQDLGDWEKDLYYMAWCHQPLQEIIDETVRIFNNPIFVCNWQGNVLGYSSAYADAAFESTEMQTTWRSITVDKRVPITALSGLMDSNYRDYLSRENSVHIMEFPSFDFRSIFGLVHVQGEIVLQFQIIEHTRKITAADISLAKVFLELLRRSFRESLLPQHSSALDVFKQLLSGNEPSEKALEWALDYLGWSSPDSEYALIIIREDDGSSCDNRLYQRIEGYIPGCRLLEYEKDMLMLLSDALLYEFRRELLYVLKSFHLKASVSLPFTDWHDLSVSYEQALLTLQYCSDTDPLCFSLDYAWNLLADTVSKHQIRLNLLHPAIKILSEYDRKNASSLAETLHTYLVCERSIVETSEALFIHRHTLKYRLDKISQLIDVDLDDFSTRMHLLLSFHFSSDDFYNPRK